MSNFNLNDRLEKIDLTGREDMATARVWRVGEDALTRLLHDFVAEVMPEMKDYTTDFQNISHEYRNVAIKATNQTLQDIQANVERALETKHD